MTRGDRRSAPHPMVGDSTDVHVDLFAHLNRAVRRLDEGDLMSALPLLRDVLREVKRLEGAGTLGPEDGEALAAATERLIQRLERAA